MIASIVEGQSEVEALPILIRRFLYDAGAYEEDVGRPIRIKRSLIVKEGELEKSAELAKRMTPGVSAILLVIDADEDCPKELGPSLLKRLTEAASGLPCSVVLANCEFEAWFVASIESLRGERGITANASAPQWPEDIRDAKGWLTREMQGARTYLATHDQAALAAKFGFDLALKRSRSFRKFSKDVKNIVEQLMSNSVEKEGK